MKVREMLKIQEAFENKIIPDDILNGDNFYWSESKQTHINILDLDLHHLIRIFIKNLKNGKDYLIDYNKIAFNKLEATKAIGRILDEIPIIQKGIND